MSETLGSVQFKNITKTFGNTVALDQFNLKLEPGEFVTLLGASGSGKTTALNIIAGFSDATSGEVYIDDKLMTGIASENRNVGMVFQSFALFPHMTVLENVAFPLRMRKTPKREADARSMVALEMVKLQELAQRKPAELSGGQRQRVGLARAVVFQPPVLLMDECLSALDLKLREELQGEIRRIHREVGTTVLFVTHDQTEALTLSDKVAVLNGGRIVQIDDPKTLYDRPRTRFVADFVGRSNTFDVIDIVNGRAALRDLDALIPVEEASTCAICVRPECIQIAPEKASDSLVVFEGTLVDETFFGSILAQTIRLPSGREVERRCQRSLEADPVSVGSNIKLGFNRADVAPLLED